MKEYQKPAIQVKEIKNTSLITASLGGLESGKFTEITGTGKTNSVQLE